MLRFGVFNLIAGVLQLTVPSYGLRLVRRFGSQRVGWFLVIAFGSLALVHLAQPIGSPSVGWASNQNLVYVLASALLLIGMGHLETMFSDRTAAKFKDENLQSWFKLQLESMHRSQAEMQQDIARREEVQKALHESEEHYRFLFTENPVPMLIVDPRSLRFVAANKAALRQYGFALEEFMELKLQDLVTPNRQAAFLRDVVKPCSAEDVRGCWEHRRKDQTLLHVEITA